MARELVWLDQPRFRGWGCSHCAWVYNPPGPPIGETFDAMMRNYEAQRDKEFALHVCASHGTHPMPPKKPRS